MRVVCTKCNGSGYINYHGDNEVWSEVCEKCKGKGVLGDIIIDDIVDVVNDEMVYITKKEYEKLLEYKHKYEDLCF